MNSKTIILAALVAASSVAPAMADSHSKADTAIKVAKKDRTILLYTAGAVVGAGFLILPGLENGFAAILEDGFPSPADFFSNYTEIEPRAWSIPAIGVAILACSLYGLKQEVYNPAKAYLVKKWHARKHA